MDDDNSAIEQGSASSLTLTPLLLAAFASAGAGLIHAAAAGSHNGDRTLAVLFAVTAAAQLGWAALAMARPTRGVAVAGALLNTVFVLAWLLTRTVGISFIAALSDVDPMGFQDTVAAALAVVAVAASAWSLAAESPPQWLRHSSLAAVAGLAVVLVTVPAMAAGHDHDHAANTELAAPADEPDDLDTESVVFVEDLPEEPEADAEADEPAGGYDHDHGPGGPVTSLYDPRLTPEQRDAARQLIDDTYAGMERYPDVESVIAAGYFSIGDGITGFEHFVSPAFIGDGIELDPERIESIVARVNPDGTKDIVSAMYLMSPGSTMDDAPDIAGPITKWHDHQDLCWEGIRVVGRIQADGTCARGTFRGTAPMLHVWLVPHACGPFAGLEGHGGGCAHDDH